MVRWEKEIVLMLTRSGRGEGKGGVIVLMGSQLAIWTITCTSFISVLLRQLSFKAIELAPGGSGNMNIIGGG